MVAMRKPFGWFGQGETVSDRATARAFKVGKKAHEKSGVSPLLKEVVALYRENSKTE